MISPPTFHLPSGYRSRPAIEADASAVAALQNAVQTREGGRADVGAESVLEDWSTLDLASDTVVILDDADHIAAHASLVNRQHAVIVIYPEVDPSHEKRGLGSALIGWGEAQAHLHMVQADPRHRVVARHYPNRANSEALHLLNRHGYAEERDINVMEIALPAPTSMDRAAPDHIKIEAFRPGIDDHQAFDAMEDAFRDIWGRPPGTFDRFQRMLHAETFDPGLMLIAWDGDQIAGQAWSTITDGEAWTNAVGVRRPWRRRGIGQALLAQSFAAQAARGATRSGLSVDSQSATGAPRLYLRAGMRLQRTHVLMDRELRPGIDPSDPMAD